MVLTASSISQWLALLLVCVAGTANGIPWNKEGWPRTPYGLWLPQDNEVVPSAPSALDLGLGRPSKGFKALVKALALLRFNKSWSAEVEPVDEVEFTTEAPDLDYVLAASVAAPIVDDLPDLPQPYLPHFQELDASHKFTHSFRFGFGSPR